ncbi:unnamed protein product [Protopolystoma xenopodis]|uniref:Uncharacterized protein n=1 Tax=Protopolystoma xenopodis TaxID=117903 RepID=A0A3S5AZ34_9PLAT|nr:unnamed protein product [Protopolystoma xenopodis]
MLQVLAFSASPRVNATFSPSSLRRYNRPSSASAAASEPASTPAGLSPQGMTSTADWLITRLEFPTNDSPPARPEGE